MRKDVGEKLQLGGTGHTGLGSWASARHIFIIAPTGKSGTNLLLNILINLKLAQRPIDGPLSREDYLLYHSDLLTEYANRTTLIWTKWKESQQGLPETASRLLVSIGDGLLSFFGPTGELPTVVKTPTTRNLMHSTQLFPSAKFLLIVRDGRDATESGMLSGYWSVYGEAFSAWAEGVRELLTFIRGPGAESCGKNWVLMRYEGLLQSPEDELRPTIELLGGSPDIVNRDVIQGLPVYGSSDYGVGADGTFRWCVAERTESFQPIGRWNDWPRSTKDLFKKVAGNELIELGYEEDFNW